LTVPSAIYYLPNFFVANPQATHNGLTISPSGPTTKICVKAIWLCKRSASTKRGKALGNPHYEGSHRRSQNNRGT